MKAFLQRNAIPLFLGFVALALAITAYQQQGVLLVFDGLDAGLSILWTTLPLLVAAFLTAGLIQALVKEQTVKYWLGSRSGWRGLLLACLAGALIPGGPYVYYPIAAVLLKTGAGLGVLVAFISAKNLWSISRIPLEIALLGPQITFTRYWITLVVPPLLGFLAELIFGKMIEQIRENVQ
jgi:uncharacterized membrane protein YraQ (UPF0718 family)